MAGNSKRLNTIDRQVDGLRTTSDVMFQRGLRPTHENSLKIKRKKGIRWMPWHQKAMKDVALCDKFRGDESNL